MRACVRACLRACIHTFRLKSHGIWGVQPPPSAISTCTTPSTSSSAPSIPCRSSSKRRRPHSHSLPPSARPQGTSPWMVAEGGYGNHGPGQYTQLTLGIPNIWTSSHAPRRRRKTKTAWRQQKMAVMQAPRGTCMNMQSPFGHHLRPTPPPAPPSGIPPPPPSGAFG